MQQGFLGAGDELRLDAVGFVLVAPGLETSAPSAAATAMPRPRTAVRKWAPIVLTAVTVLVIAAVTLIPG